MTKVLETLLKTLCLCHMWVKILKDEVNIGVIIAYIIGYEESNSASDLIVINYLK
jgi:hypothetical protein